MQGLSQELTFGQEPQKECICPWVFPGKWILGTGGAWSRILSHRVPEMRAVCEGDVWGQGQGVRHVLRGQDITRT